MILMLFTSFLTIHTYMLLKENNTLEEKNSLLQQKLKAATEKSAHFQSNVKEVNGFYDRCLENSRKLEKKYKKISYFHYMLKRNSKAMMEKLKKRLHNFQIPSGDCDLFSFFKKTFDKFKNFYEEFYEKT